MKLTWKEIKAHPKKALSHIKSLEKETAQNRVDWRQMKELLDCKLELIGYAKRLESELYDLKKRFDLPREGDFRPVVMSEDDH